jgi:hypothetical protein
MGTPINSTAAAVTGLSISSILFSTDKRVSSALQLGAIRRGKSVTVLEPDASEGLKLSQMSLLAPAISPDGHAAIVARPVAAIPSSWEAYQTRMPEFFRFQARVGDAQARSGTRGLWPSQYALIDLDRHSVRSLVEAPGGRVGGYSDSEKAVWSPRGTAVLLTNTYLPLEGVDSEERTRRLQACAAAVIRIASGVPSCVVLSRTAPGQKNPWAVYEAAFGQTDDDLRLRLRWYSHERTERYQYIGGHWNLVKTAGAVTGTDATHSSLQVAIRQDLNVPPALWAIDTRSGKAKKLWDPNPELSSMQVGEASVYHWKDSTGYDWSASLIKPVGYVPGQRYPLIIQTHGFHNEHEFITDGAYTTAFAARPLAAAGFMVLETRDRHDHDVTSEEAPNMVRGFESAIDVLNAEGLIDVAKVGIIGFSRTSYYTESALIHAPQRYAAAVMADGVDESYMTYLLWGEGRDVREQEAIYGTPPFGEGMKKWVELAPGFNLNRVQTPLLIQAISAPSILEEWEIYASLRLQKKPVDMIYFPEGQHILQKPLERLASQQSDVDWFRFWLQDYEDLDPARAEQYKRWRELRKLQIAQDAERASASKEQVPVH